MLKVAFLLLLQAIFVPCYVSSLPNKLVSDPVAYVAGNRVKVILKSEEVWAQPGTPVQVPCDYQLIPDSDLPVTITWKVGDGPRFATDVIKCSGYSKATRKCSNLEIIDDAFNERVTIAPDSPSLEIQSVAILDNRNYWCQVSTEEISNCEMETDMQSVVLRVYGGGEMPKFHSVKIDDNFSASLGSSITIGCECANDYHCEDVAWFKGPTDPTSSSYEMVYTRVTYSRPNPTEYQAYGNWIGRATLQGDSLVIENLQDSDAGKYWCELRSSSYYGIGEWATDAKSMILDVLSTSNYFQCPEADGNYTDYQDCQMYFECVGGKSFHRRCPVGTVFDANTCRISALASSGCGEKTLN